MKNLMMLALCAFVANAAMAAVKIGDLYYDLDDSTMTAEVVRDSSYMKLTSIEIPMSMSSEDKTYTVTSIGEKAFFGCPNLTGELMIPSSVTHIGDMAFGVCSGLSGELMIPSSVTHIGNSVFVSCSGLTGVTISASVTSIGVSAFANCTGLTGELTIPASVTNIGESAFYGCSGLTSVTIPSSVTDISNYMFTECSGLTSVTISASVTNIGIFAFSACSGLTDVTIPASVTSIGNSAFSYCERLAEVTLCANEPPTAGAYVFDEVSDALVVFVPVESIEEYRTADGWSSYAEKICDGWTAGDTVKVYRNGSRLFIMGSGAMDDFASAEAVPWAAVADQVTAVTVEDGVTKIGKNAWAGMADAVTINGTALSVIGFAAPGLASGEPVIPDDKVLVSKESIAAAKAMTVQIMNGQIELSVSVSTNADITAEVPWAPVKFTPDTQIGLSSDGTKLILPIPVAAQQGFMILQSGDAKAVPSNGAKQGFYKLEAR